MSYDQSEIDAIFHTCPWCGKSNRVTVEEAMRGEPSAAHAECRKHLKVHDEWVAERVAVGLPPYLTRRERRKLGKPIHPLYLPIPRR